MFMGTELEIWWNGMGHLFFVYKTCAAMRVYNNRMGLQQTSSFEGNTAVDTFAAPVKIFEF